MAYSLSPTTTYKQQDGDKCALCSTPYKDPSSIPCGHIFCFPCLQSHIARTSQDGYDAKCPTCQTDFPFSTPDVNLVMKPLQKHLHAGIRRVHIDIDTKENDQLALELAEAKTTLAHLQDILAESHTVLAAKGAALEEVATQLENQTRKADDLQAQLNIEKEVTEKQKRELEGLRADKINIATQLQTQTRKADELQAKLNSEKEVTEKERRDLLEALRAQQVKLESSSVPIPTALSARPAAANAMLPTVLPTNTTPKRTAPEIFGAVRGGSPAKRPRGAAAPHGHRQP